MNLYCTTTEIKTFLGISGNTLDTVLDMLNKQATMLVNGILNVSDLAVHKVSAEVHDSMGKIFELRDVNVLKIGKILDNDEVYTQDEEYDIDDYVLHLENSVYEGKRKLKIDYAAGWNASGMAYIDITDYTLIVVGKKVTIGASNYVVGTNWNAVTDNEITATNLATALNADTLARAFAVGSRVYVVDRTVGLETSTIMTDATGLTLTATGGKLAGVNFPEDIKGAIYLLVSTMNQQRKNPKMRSYTIGSKTVSFASDSEFTMFKDYLAPYKRAKVQAI